MSFCSQYLPDVVSKTANIGSCRRDHPQAEPIRFDPVYQIQGMNGNWAGIYLDRFAAACLAMKAFAALLQAEKAGGRCRISPRN